MKFKTNKLSLNLVLASSLLAASIPAFAVTGDTDQPIHIESDQQSLDMQGNVVTFTGNVIVTQGTIKINADKVVVTRPGGEQGKEVIDGYGKPTRCRTTVNPLKVTLPRCTTNWQKILSF